MAVSQRQFVNRVREEGFSTFYVGLPFVVAAIVCFVVAMNTSTHSRDKKKQKAARQKKILLLVLGSLLALAGVFFWTPFFMYLFYFGMS